MKNSYVDPTLTTDTTVATLAKLNLTLVEVELVSGH